MCTLSQVWLQILTAILRIELQRSKSRDVDRIDKVIQEPKLLGDLLELFASRARTREVFFLSLFLSLSLSLKRNRREEGRVEWKCADP